ncbi:aminoacyl-histidine dipeptidase [Alkalitalea saponilacus]|uniref:Cytosol non-specific dipeptidase n=1 Tax=Alkalitalea saponilacus TaxID=889453 RepID=A0A1T5G997_9BACT|nr:aminoacyl-histidine dipeptidase [Alkalitalea saponilacus]ASB47896.1 beta-Ala-His dipeptidase [Alkalitalea saponilacus]SKC04958.1 dipeptidase D [Alkalitalea saponilacus]
MYPFENLKPAEIWTYFHEICQIPRPSKNEEKMINYLIDFAEKHGLDLKKDKIGNLVISKPATAGFESLPSVVLQSHIDMVCEKNNETVHNFMTDSINPYIDREWVKAKGTTLGADDGIGIAAQLAILASKEIEHGHIECLFTVDEETGLTGAFELEPDMFSGKILINLDSEDEGEIFIGCAGGIGTIGYFNPEFEATSKDAFAFKVSVSGLKGGHSGDDIDKGLGNAIKILNRYIYDATRQFGFQLATIEGGNLHNAIAREASATGVVPWKYKEEVRVLINCFIADLQEEIGKTEPHIKLHLESISLPEKILTKDFHNRLVNTIYAMPHGVITMSSSVPGLVETSTNLASINFEGEQLVINTSQRSALESGINNIANMVDSVFKLGEATTKQTDGYPGWNPNPDSSILKTAVETYKMLFKTEPQVKAIHAGLECGLFLQKYPGLDMISIGPTIKGAHSPDERLNIETVQKFWDHLLAILKHVA